MEKEATASRYTVRLRQIRLSRDIHKMLEWYNNKKVLYYSEGHTRPYDEPVIKRMHKYLTSDGKRYIIEIKKGRNWIPVGDASMTKTSTPITIGLPRYWGKGIGLDALKILIKKAKRSGWKEMKVSGISDYNKRSIRMYKSAGFKPVSKDKNRGKEIRMILKL